MIPELDKRTIADYLIEFDNLKIPEPDLEEIPKEKEITYEEVMQSLEKILKKEHPMKKYFNNVSFIFKKNFSK